MSKRWATGLWTRTARRQMAALTRSALRVGTKLVKKAMKAPTKTALKSAALSGLPNMKAGLAGLMRYQLYRPPARTYTSTNTSGTHTTQPSPELALVVMLHGCGQDASTFSASTRMNRLAKAQGFMVLYPEQERSANAQGCWNWFATRSGKAQREAANILMAVNQVCALHDVDRRRVVVAGMSAGGSMAALLALSYPSSFAAVVMHSGVGPGLASSAATALAAMRGHHSGLHAAGAQAVAAPLPALLVIQGSRDPVVAPTNGALAAKRWAAMVGATESPPRTVQNGARYPVRLTHWTVKRRAVVTLASVQGLGHAWSGGPASIAYSDSAGPDASRMVWAFAQRVFASDAVATKANLFTAGSDSLQRVR